MLGLSQVKIQRGVGYGNITINAIDPAKSIILCSTMMYATQLPTGAASHGYGHGTIVNATTINISAGVMAWTVIEFGGAV